jgi:hypothetical protein
LISTTSIAQIERASKAGALENGNKNSEGAICSLSSMLTLFPNLTAYLSWSTSFTDPLVGCAQMRWAPHQRKLQSSDTFANNHARRALCRRTKPHAIAPADSSTSMVLRESGVDRRSSSVAVGQHDTLTEDTDLSFRAQLMGWRFCLPAWMKSRPAEIPVEINAFKATSSDAGPRV